MTLLIRYTRGYDYHAFNTVKFFYNM